MDGTLNLGRIAGFATGIASATGPGWPVMASQAPVLDKRSCGGRRGQVRASADP